MSQEEPKQEVANQPKQEVINQEEPKITTAEKPKEKNPKRVAAGKRLAAISKAAKEEKMRRLLQEEETHWKRYLLLSVGIGVLGFAGYKHFFAEKPKLQPYEEKVHEEMKTDEKVKPEKKKRGNEVRGKPISMFD